MVMVSASPVRWSIKSWGRMATDSSQMEKAQRICAHCQRLLLSFPIPVTTHLCERVAVRKQYRQHCTSADEILHLEGIEIGVVGRLVVVEHEVDGVRGTADEDDLEDGVVERFGQVEGPEKIDVSCHVYDEVEELRLE